MEARAPSNAEILDYLDCGFDTLDIARMCRVAEHVVYNRLSRLTNGFDAPQYRAGKVANGFRGGPLGPEFSSIAHSSVSVAGTEESTDGNRKIRTT